MLICLESSISHLSPTFLLSILMMINFITESIVAKHTQCLLVCLFIWIIVISIIRFGILILFLLMIILVISHYLVMRIVLCFEVLIILKSKHFPVWHLAHIPFSELSDQLWLLKEGHANWELRNFSILFDYCGRWTASLVKGLHSESLNLLLLLSFVFHLFSKYSRC